MRNEYDFTNYRKFMIFFKKLFEIVKLLMERKDIKRRRRRREDIKRISLI